jgi:hypothetical protein
MKARSIVSLLILALLVAVLGWLFLRRPPAPRAPVVLPASPELDCPRDPPAPAVAPPSVPPDRVRWIFIGAVDSPSLNQVSIEQDGELLRSVLGENGLMLSGGGPGARDVQVATRPGSRRDGGAFLQELADLIAPRGGRDSRYRRSRLPLHGAARAVELEATLRRVLRPAAAAGRSPLLLYIGGHGEQGATARDAYVSLWGGRRLTARALATWLDEGSRPLALVVTSCFGGGFAETVFRGADPERGIAVGRCGFFATTPDLPATGCDPNPDRQAQEGYALRFFQALAGRDRDGKPLPRETLDLDGDGRVSLAEAHAHARVALRSVDVPTTTSERWLRHVAPKSGPRRAVPLVEEHAVARALARRTGLPEELEAVRRALAAREAAAEQARQRVEEGYAAEDETALDAIGELLARWPVLDDPWHPDFLELLRCRRAAIEAHLRASPAYADYLEARDAVDSAEVKYWELRRRAAPVERLARALENIVLAERLRARGGPAWESYAALLACERTRLLSDERR